MIRLAWATLGDEICGDRKIEPRPVAVIYDTEVVFAEDGLATGVAAWLQNNVAARELFVEGWPDISMLMRAEIKGLPQRLGPVLQSLNLGWSSTHRRTGQEWALSRDEGDCKGKTAPRWGLVQAARERLHALKSTQAHKEGREPPAAPEPLG